MDYINIVQSINKVAVIAFFAILLLIGVEIFMMFKGKKKSLIKIPDFDPKFGKAAKVATTTVASGSMPASKSMVRMLVISTLLLILFGLMAVFGHYTLSNREVKNAIPQPVPLPQVELVESDGIIVFGQDWKKIQPQNISVTEGEMLYIGVATVKGTDIDKARIKINKPAWELTDETTQFNKQNSVYYVSYTIATSESSLKIDAQLHSKMDGWLEE